MRPNPPRMVTVVLAVVLTIVGLALIYVPTGDAADMVQRIGLPRDIERQIVGWIAERFVAYLALAASPVLLILGSLLKGL